MPLQGLMLILFMIIIIPILLIFSNHNVFFILISLILLYTSLKNIYFKVFNSGLAASDSEEDLSEELEQTMNVNVKKFKDGILVAKNLIIILFLAYCTFFISDFLLKILIALILTFRFTDIYKLFRKDKNLEPTSALIQKVKNVFSLFIDIITVTIIIIVSISKYLKFIA